MFFLQVFILQTPLKLTGANSNWQYLKNAMKQRNIVIILKPCANKLFQREHINQISKVAQRLFIPIQFRFVT